MGPLISPQAKERVCSLVQSGVDQGAKLLLDGRNVRVKGYEKGNFVGPTIIGNVTVRGFTNFTHTLCVFTLRNQPDFKLPVKVFFTLCPHSLP